MAQASNQTVANSNSVQDFIEGLSDTQQQADSLILVNIMQRVTGKPATMWGPAIIGFGSHHYKYESGREGDEPDLAFSPRAGKLTLYIMNSSELFHKKLEKLGSYKTANVCLYIRRLADVDMKVLEELIKLSYDADKASRKDA